MKKILLILMMLSLTVPALYAQTNPDDVPLPKSLQTKQSIKNNNFENKKVKFTAGGNFGLVFRDYVGISLAPLFGVYPGVNWIVVGVEGDLRYTYYYSDKTSYFDFGVSAFVRGLIWKQRLIVHFSYDYLSIDLGKNLPRINAQALYIGPGYNQKVDRLNIFIVLKIRIASTYKEYNAFPIWYPSIGISYDF
ncbi:MAG: hypothetical protein LBU51_06530 [Bacteroidales bacterium]|jgi:hypothetical protein|nr:hypothetical protein [Bacteroidales bacterium]